ncbi:hypothetical protein [Myroides odoratus]|jgi:hypothetical protein|uniref:Uncharacterized protein n=1 Tax=Myroides odoratus TaxID=256 RepID=A0A9Q7EBC9_MYROD|nr:hypothetical protein [Myroides odoratus]EHQ43883.1 hypothetical protein Myrod_3065 [Myroides odoratus DSM 2801]EKB05000.1 hypothetical protein HMPREF9716_03031 [Myroides odoratus CIP 103059]QQU01189.1 hypothetical protein I6I88_05400 [Myroides odoratus]WQD56555.1 hypothetical protein U0010_13630 [Myroides odoratus]STZ31159.1 Uncharacterised protein [Myroides odoratus]
MKKLFFVVFLLWGYLQGYAQVGIGINKPSSSAMLDIHSTGGNKGVLFPKVALIDTKSYAPIIGNSADMHNVGLLVYNITTDVAKGLHQGYYYWTGTTWVGLPNTEVILDLVASQTSIGGVYYGKINGGTQDVLYVKKQDAQGNDVEEALDLMTMLVQDVSNLTEENIFMLKKAFGYDITEHIVYTGKSIQGKYQYSVYGQTEIEEGNAEVGGVRLSRESLQLLEEGVIFDIHLVNANQQLIDINITDIEVTTAGVLKFSLGTSSMYFTLPAGGYGVIVDLLSLREHFE